MLHVVWINGLLVDRLMGKHSRMIHWGHITRWEGSLNYWTVDYRMNKWHEWSGLTIPQGLKLWTRYSVVWATVCATGFHPLLQSLRMMRTLMNLMNWMSWKWGCFHLSHHCLQRYLFLVSFPPSDCRVVVCIYLLGAGLSLSSDICGTSPRSERYGVSDISMLLLSFFFFFTVQAEEGNDTCIDFFVGPGLFLRVPACLITKCFSCHYMLHMCSITVMTPVSLWLMDVFHVVVVIGLTWERSVG